MGRFEKSKFDQIKARKYHDEIVAKRKKVIYRLIAVAAVVVGIYLVGSFYFTKYYYPHTTVNGVDCSWKTVKMSCQILEEVTDGYTVTITGSDGLTEEITGEEIGLKITPEERMRELMDGQTGFAWVRKIFDPPEEVVFENTIFYDEDALSAAVDSLSCLSGENSVEPVPPALSDYIEGVGYEVIEPVTGRSVDRDRLLAALNREVSQMGTSVDLEEEGCYIDTAFDEEVERLEGIRDKLNNIVNTTITYEFGDNKEVLDGTQLNEWLILEEEQPLAAKDGSEAGSLLTEVTLEEFLESGLGADELKVSVDSAPLEEFVYNMALTYNTKHQSHKLTTHTGETVTVSGGNYGWYINQAQTLEDLESYVNAGEDYTGEAVFFQRAAQFDFPDYGSTYLEVSLSEQHFWYYRDGVLMLDSDLVSGNPSTGHETPKGTYQIAYKARDQVLSGEDYETPVSYWMPFYAGVGFHDATWRSSFGGTIYEHGGSHGCLNLPYSVAEELYGYIEGGECVLIY